MTGPIFDTHAHYSARAIDSDRFALQDSFGTACNVSGDNAIGVIVETIYQKFINKSSASV